MSSLDGAMGSFTAFVAAIGIITLIVFVLMAAGRGWRWLWLSWLLVAALVGTWLVAFNLVSEPEAGQTASPVVQTLLDWRELPAIGRLGKILESDSGTGKVRVLIWEGAIDLISPHEPLQFPDGSTDSANFLRLLLGYGPESMYVAYNGFYLPELATVEARNASPDRSHNETIDALVITGMAGFLVWQLLYIAIFYYGFRWLGVVRTARDRNMLIGLWLLGAISGGISISSILGIEFFGVAIPFGSIVGLVIYLIYYALFANIEDGATTDPFNADRLLLTGLVTAIIAHYIEIHFGIAIASTRTHFFVYVGLIFLVGYLLPQIKGTDFAELGAEQNQIAEEEKRVEQPKRRRRRSNKTTQRRHGSWGWMVPALSVGLILALIVGTLGFNFMTYNLPPGNQINSLEDVPSAWAIFQQSMLVHARQGFSPSPYLFLLVMLTWGLGTLLFLSEFTKEKIFSLQKVVPTLADNKVKIAIGIFGAWAVAGILIRFLGVEETATTTNRLGGSLALLLDSIMCVGRYLFDSKLQVRHIDGGWRCRHRFCIGNSCDDGWCTLNWARFTA